MSPASVATRFNVPERFISNLLSHPVPEMQFRDRYLAPSNCETPTTDFPRYPRYTPKIQHWHPDPLEAYVDYIEIIDPRKVFPSEPEGGIRMHPSFARYLEWLRAGYQPPYPSVFEQIHDGGSPKLIGSNRRRILTAQDAGLTEITVWLGRWNQKTGLPLKYGDIIHAIQTSIDIPITKGNLCQA